MLTCSFHTATRFYHWACIYGTWPYESLEQKENVTFPFGKWSVSTWGRACSRRIEFSICPYKLYFISYTTVMCWTEHWMQSQGVGLGFCFPNSNISRLFVVNFMRDRNDIVQLGGQEQQFCFFDLAAWARSEYWRHNEQDSTVKSPLSPPRFPWGNIII